MSEYRLQKSVKKGLQKPGISPKLPTDYGTHPAMKLPREVKIRIRPDGKVEIATVGFVGESCVKLSEILERALAGSGPVMRLALLVS